MEVLDAEELLEPSGRPVAPGENDRRPCPMCGEMIVASALKCRFCGEIFDESLAASEQRRTGRTTAESVEEMARRLIEEKQNKSTAIQIFVTSILGCFAPIVLIYGIVFLLRRPYSFPCKGLAIAGTVIHGFWTALLILTIIAQNLGWNAP
jgi:rubredoxin